MQINPFLVSLAAPAAARSVRAIAQAGQSFMATFADVASAANEQASDAAKPLGERFQSFAGRLREWLRDQGVHGSYSLQFHVDAQGEPVTNVVGRDSQRIIELLHEGSSGWLDRLTEMAQEAKQTLGGPDGRTTLSITDSEAQITTKPHLARSFRPTG